MPCCLPLTQALHGCRAAAAAWLRAWCRPHRTPTAPPPPPAPASLPCSCCCATCPTGRLRQQSPPSNHSTTFEGQPSTAAARAISRPARPLNVHGWRPVTPVMPCCLGAARPLFLRPRCAGPPRMTRCHKPNPHPLTVCSLSPSNEQSQTFFPITPLFLARRRSAQQQCMRGGAALLTSDPSSRFVRSQSVYCTEGAVVGRSGTGVLFGMECRRYREGSG